MKILIIEDEPELNETLQSVLQSEQYITESAFSCEEAYSKIAVYDYDCILLDLMLPDGSGMDILKEIKNLHKKSAVIILSAKDSVEDKVDGLEIGADDYIAKPFHVVELIARIKSVIRRNNHAGEQSITIENVELFSESRQVLVNHSELKLNRKEFDLLYYFMIRPGKTLQRTVLAEAIWGDAIDQSDTYDFLYSQIKNLKKKLKQSRAEIDIQAVYGIGYKLINE